MNTIINKTDAFVLNLFNEKLPQSFVYHNYTHTCRVVKSTKEIIDNTEGLSEYEVTTLLVAAWLHDTGYTVSCDNHEDHSKTIAIDFLNKENVSKEIIDGVVSCIEATRMSNTPKNKLDEILRDADASHLAKEYYKEISELLRQELILHDKKNYTISEWLDANIDLFTNKHQYFTSYAIKNWQPKKNENLLNLLKDKNKQQKILQKEKQKVTLKNENPERSIQTLFRVTMRNHLKLSDIADTKANILLSVNAIIITLAVSNLGPKLDNPNNVHLLIPTLILLLFSVAAIIGAILSTRPNVTSGQFTKDQVLKREVNVLFFGNFHKMPYKEYRWAMDEIINDKDYVYEALMKDLYLLGIVLDKKYKLLRITYTIFMAGIIISVFAFIFSFKFI
ncbi:MAG: phosphohydrolase [Bacteroidetes bacterium HGW-Bacteroidetes-2]|jgi:HD superfamily phosphodiesterase|nr:MAG: phosphohydrolase [Bacteroidetes bacterium HGW-Bacteroidetes-2]